MRKKREIIFFNEFLHQYKVTLKRYNRVGQLLKMKSGFPSALDGTYLIP